MFQVVLICCGLLLWILDKKHDIYFYKCNRRLMLASRCSLVESLYFVFFDNSELLTWHFMYYRQYYYLFVVPHFQFCKTHCSVVNYVGLMPSCALFFLLFVATVKPPVTTTSRKQLPLLSDQFPKIPKVSQSNHYIWNLL